MHLVTNTGEEIDVLGEFVAMVNLENGEIFSFPLAIQNLKTLHYLFVIGLSIGGVGRGS